MTSLSELFPDGPRTDLSGGAVIDDHHTVRRLREMIGAPRDVRGPVRPLADTAELMRMVEAAASNAGPVSAGAEEPERPAKRPPRRVDVLTVTAAALAAVSVVAAAAVGGVQMATASPAASSLQSLEADEATILNAHQSLIAARDRLLADVESQTADAALLRSTLSSTSTLPDPASDGDFSIDVTDAAALAPALAAVDAYAAGLAEIVVPELPAEYARGKTDEESLTEVGSAIDDAQEKLVELDAATTEMRSLRIRLDTLRPTAELAVATYAATFPAAADAAKARYPDADEALLTNLTDAAVRVSSTSLWGSAGASTLQAYRDALSAVVGDQLRVEIEGDRGTTRQPSRSPVPQPTQPPADTGGNPDEEPVAPLDPGIPDPNPEGDSTP